MRVDAASYTLHEGLLTHLVRLMLVLAGSELLGRLATQTTKLVAVEHDELVVGLDFDGHLKLSRSSVD